MSDLMKRAINSDELTEAEAVALLPEWYEKGLELKRLKAEESHLRGLIFKALFPQPKEGVNSYPLEDDYSLKATYKLDRKIDEGAFLASREALTLHEVNPDLVTRTKIELVKTEYNKLTDKQKLIMDGCIIMKPSTPSLTIALPKG